MTPYQRLEKIAELEERTVNQIVELSGRHPSIVSAIRTGKKSLSQDLADAIELKWKYRSEWILSGQGDMKETEYQSNGVVKPVNLRPIRIAQSFDLVPILKTPLYARAGFGYTAYLNRPPEEQEWESIPFDRLYPGIPPEDHTIVTINGDSMEPRLEAGWEMLAYKTANNEFPRIGKIVMLDYKDELIIKTLVEINIQKRTITVQSYNNKETREIPMDEIRRVFHVYDHWKAFL
ncbi:S24 family peptidase [Spirosoma sp. BT702]|uniref:S24 family peptidase n=2 Tax=Spirosoma profusum TaxID=2771354 RepID=A0A926XWY1_9BACT|nr:S24 family peptidase [Spirosoma profusum]